MLSSSCGDAGVVLVLSWANVWGFGHHLSLLLSCSRNVFEFVFPAALCGRGVLLSLLRGREVKALGNEFRAYKST